MEYLRYSQGVITIPWEGELMLDYIFVKCCSETNVLKSEEKKHIFETTPTFSIFASLLHTICQFN